MRIFEFVNQNSWSEMYKNVIKRRFYFLQICIIFHLSSTLDRGSRFKYCATIYSYVNWLVEVDLMSHTSSKVIWRPWEGTNVQRYRGSDHQSEALTTSYIELHILNKFRLKKRKNGSLCFSCSKAKLSQILKL